MLIFRSEDHIDRWCEMWGQPHGGTLSIEQCWKLANAWYGKDRRDDDWRRNTLDESKALFQEIGMTDPFWKLGG